MSTEENKALVRRVWEEAFNKRNLAVADELLAQNSVNHEAPAGPLHGGPEDLKQIISRLTSAFPDHHTIIEDMIAEGDKVMIRTTFSGTHQGPFMGIPPTGKRFSLQQIHVVRIVDGKATEHWGVFDNLSMMQQLGVIPARE
jgi:steroid delta-isomerase-like uncharacterized protein